MCREPNTDLSCWFDLDCLMRFITMPWEQAEPGRTNASSQSTKIFCPLQKQNREKKKVISDEGNKS